MLPLSEHCLLFILHVCLDHVDQFIRFLFAKLTVTKKSIYKSRKRTAETSFDNMFALL